MSARELWLILQKITYMIGNRRVPILTIVFIWVLRVLSVVC